MSLKNLSATIKIPNILKDKLKNKKITQIYKRFEKSIDLKERFIVAVSGGPDSLALAFLSKIYSIKKNLDTKFFIVDHKLRNGSTDEALKVKRILRKFKINVKILTWVGRKPNKNIQSIARIARYDLLFSKSRQLGINYILTGHQQGDLIENFFIRMLRGSGLKGLISFADLSINLEDNFRILRPLIKIQKKELIYISKSVFNFFVNDPSNENLGFQRSRIRKLILDLENEGLDKKKLDLTIKNLKCANDGINFYVKKNIKNNAKFVGKKKTYILNKYFFNQSEEVIFRSISFVLKKISGRYYSPRGKSISDSMVKINSLKCKRFTLGGCFIEKINETVFITREN